MNVNKMMEDYFKKHDEEVIESAKLRIIKEATPKIIEDAKLRIEDATPKIIEDATPKIIEETTYNIAKRFLEIGVSVDDIQKATHLSDEQIKSLISK